MPFPTTSNAGPTRDPDLALELILRCAECVPPGRVVAYGDIARIVGTGPRQVGRAMALYGSSTPWWRVTNASGALPAHLLSRASEHWVAEGTPLAAGGMRVSMRGARADLAALENHWRERVSGLLTASEESRGALSC